MKSPLAPQTSTDKELGLTWKSDKSSARLSWFRYDLRNEIQYNPLGDGIWGPGTGGNINLDPTRRQGIELEGHHALTSSITLDANLTWMEAKFRSGTYSGVDLAGKQVPLVPKWLANAGVTWRPTDALLWNVSAQYVGKSRMDNDQANQFGEELNAYVLFNTAGLQVHPQHRRRGGREQHSGSQVRQLRRARRQHGLPVPGLHGALQPVPSAWPQLLRFADVALLE